MSKRAIMVAGCLLALAGWLFVWQHATNAQTASPAPPAPATPRAQAAANPRGFPLGGPCTVYLRDDATGRSQHNLVADLSSLASVKGSLEAGGDHWIVLKSDDGKREWIPVDAVAAVVSEK